MADLLLQVCQELRITRNRSESNRWQSKLFVYIRFSNLVNGLYIFLLCQYVREVMKASLWKKTETRFEQSCEDIGNRACAAAQRWQPRLNTEEAHTRP